MSNRLKDRPTSYVLFDKNDELLGARIAKDEQWRFPMMDSIPLKFEKAITTFEDKDFNSHWGLDLSSLLRATIQNLKERRVVSGASTITMQLMRIGNPGAKRNVLQKIKEIFLAFKKELHSTKEQILLEYCTHAPFGGNVVGLETASWRYYRKAPQNLSWSEASTLAVLPNAPALIHPGKNRNQLKRKRDFLLGRLLAASYIDSMEWRLALLEPIVPNPKNLENEAPHFLEKLKSENKHMSRFNTTIDVEIQAEVNDLVERHNKLNQQKGIYNVGVIVVSNQNKKIRAYTGNTKGTSRENYNDMVLAPRSSGSILKPLLYGLAIEDGMITPSQLAEDIPISYKGFSPKNYNRKFHGAISYDKVISKSLNVPSVTLLKKYDLRRFLNDLRELGFKTLDKSSDYYGLPLILGGGDVRLWDLANVYSEAAHTLSTFISQDAQYLENPVQDLIWDRDYVIDKPSYSFQPNKLSAGSIWAMLEAMKKLERPNNDGQWERFTSSKHIHWKTGTSYGYKDAWAVGITKEYTVAVWVGNSDGEPRPDIIGVSAAGSLLFDIFNALPIRKSFDKPFDDLQKKEICLESGHIAGAHCKNIVEKFLPTKACNTQSCPYHKLIYVNKESGERVFMDCLSTSQIQDTSWFVLPSEMAYYYKSYHPTYAALPQFDEACLPYGDTEAPIAFIYPREDIEIVLPINLKSEKENCVIKASHKDEKSTIFWHVNNSYYGKTEDFHEIALDLNAGEYTVSIQDQTGQIIRKKITVLSTE